MVIHKENLGFNLEAVMANTGAVQNISMAFGRYTVRKNIKEQLLRSTLKLQLILLQLDLQFNLLISNVIALRNGVLRPTLVTYDEMLHFKDVNCGINYLREYRVPIIILYLSKKLLKDSNPLTNTLLYRLLRFPMSYLLTVLFEPFCYNNPPWWNL